MELKISTVERDVFKKERYMVELDPKDVAQKSFYRTESLKSGKIVNNDITIEVEIVGDFTYSKSSGIVIKFINNEDRYILDRIINEGKTLKFIC